VRPGSTRERRHRIVQTAALYAVILIAAALSLWAYLTAPHEAAPDPWDCLEPPRWCERLRKAHGQWGTPARYTVTTGPVAVPPRNEQPEYGATVAVQT